MLSEFNMRSFVTWLVAVASTLRLSAGQVSEYTPDSSLTTLNDFPRLEGDNEIPAELLNGDVSAEAENYMKGILAPSALMLVFLIWWLFALCCARPCSGMTNKCCKPKCVSFCFIISIALSILGFLISTSGIAAFNTGVKSAFESTDDILNAWNDYETDVNKIAEFVGTTIVNLVDDADTNCSLVFEYMEALSITLPQNLSEISGVIDEVADALKVDLITEDDINEIKEQREQVYDYANQASTYYTTMTICVIVFIAVFGIGASISAWEKSGRGGLPESLVKFNKWFHTVQCILVFTVGLLLMVLIWVFSLLTGPVVFVASDVCVPSIADNILEIYPESKGQTREQFCADSLEQKAICHYLTCEGENPIFEEMGINISSGIIGSEIDDAQADIQTLIDEINNVNFTGVTITGIVSEAELNAEKAKCLYSVQNFVDSLDQIDPILTDIVQNLECDNLSPLILDLFNDVACNGLSAGFARMFITWSIGALGFMWSMYYYCLMQVRQREEELMVAYPVDDEKKI